MTVTGLDDVADHGDHLFRDHKSCYIKISYFWPINYREIYTEGQIVMAFLWKDDGSVSKLNTQLYS